MTILHRRQERSNFGKGVDSQLGGPGAEPLVGVRGEASKEILQKSLQFTCFQFTCFHA